VTEIAIAYDVPTLDQALSLDETLGTGPEYAKVGLELFAAEGPAAVSALKARGRRVFLDLKLHDIPNTVRGAARSAARLGADLITVHATGGYAMVAAAVEGASEGGSGTRVVAVTILTSLTASTMPPGFMSPFHLVMVAPKLLELAESAGAHGIVCAAPDLFAIRAVHPQPFFAVTPGIRPAGGATHDQQRVTTVAEAVRLGSGMLVLGRAITGASDPAAALVAARAERDQAVADLATQGSPSA
jgi:orotidine-5'-phosphate decarboxylase